MSLMFLARSTRPDILFAVTALAAKCSKPTYKHYRDALRIIYYLAGTQHIGLLYKSDSDLSVKVYCDASHGIHSDGRGHGGMIITVGNSVIYAKSWKIKIVTRSSSESELYALDEASTYCLWFKTILKHFNFYIEQPLTIYEDNQSTILMAINNGTFRRSKHLLIKQNFIQQHIQFNDILLKYLSTKDMYADMLTKPMNENTLTKFMIALFIQ